MAILTKKDLLEAIEDMPMDMPVKICRGSLIMDGDYDRIKVKEVTDFLFLVNRMREAQKQWKDGDPFDGTEMELAKRMCEAEREVDEYLKKIENED